MNQSPVDVALPASFQDKGKQIPLRTPADLSIAMFDHTEALNKLLKKLRTEQQEEQ